VSRRGILRCSLAAILFGISAPAASQLAGDMGAFTLAGLLYLGAAIAVVPFVGRVRPSRRALERSAARLATAVVLGGAVGPVLLAAGLSNAPAATASLLLNLELVFTTMLAMLVFREHIGSRLVAGTTLVVAAGMAAISTSMCRSAVSSRARRRAGRGGGRDALASSGESFMPVVNGYAFRTAGLVNLRLGHTDVGRQHLHAAIEAFEQGAGTVGVGQAALCWVDLSSSFLEANDFVQARHASEAAMRLAVRVGDPWVHAQTEACVALVERASVGA
jgi:hypothetical protein